MNLLYIALSSATAYFLMKILYKRSNYIYVSSAIACLIGLIAYLIFYNSQSNDFITSIHFYVTSMSIVFLFITCYEVFLLEWRVNKVKSGEFVGLLPISIEKNYNTTFKLAGLGIAFLSLALLTGFYITDVLTTEIQLKILFTTISWLIYFAILIGIKFFNLRTKYAVRGLVFTLAFLLIAYLGNSFIFSTIT
jgi:ABC-type uncharacterized transport system permease subunit